MTLLSFFIVSSLSFAGGSLVTIRLLYWVPKYKKIIQDLLNEAYHDKLMPEVCRIEGVLLTALMEAKFGTAFTIPYIEMALEAVVQLKKNIQEALSKYHKYQ